METKVYEINPESIEKDELKAPAEVLKNGGTVAFPTETVYGLGANALDEKAVKKIFEAKGRPSDNPLIVHISKIEEIDPLVEEIPENAKKIMEKFWPGPITIILKRSHRIPDVITAGLDTVAIRMPSHPIANKLIEMSGVPVAAPSANLSGKPSPTKAEHVIHDLKGKVDVIISGGSCEVGLESTVVDATGSIPMILRPGGVTKEHLEEIFEKVEVDQAIEEGGMDLIPKSPGMKYTHYSPKAEVVIIAGAVEKVVEEINQLKKEKEKLGLRVGIMCTDETKKSYKEGVVISMGSRKDVATIANSLFATLRQFDEKEVDIIYAESIEQKLLGHAVMNRMIKAAGHHVIKIGR
ncbi:L-threonylcarbamoyladenylate synthase [Crassaminicella profunda]|uniref:L-threonylcarbamoyladenylate synthase n=1 Tax=Crassaminicella profunda TaxID=1286698 RepID=UPI001CA77261|nr:L-threonylcarbamoyladenylate synthase [Crassaminicella profunda]QZY57386.1 threonylcarbamoyl-AMP synthase [Crassaminicella profunda]